MNYQLLSTRLNGRNFTEQGKVLTIENLKNLREGKTVVFTDRYPKVFYDGELRSFLEQYFPDVSVDETNAIEVNSFEVVEPDPMEALSNDDIVMLLEDIIDETGNTEFRLNYTAEGWKLYVVKTAYRVVGPYKNVLILAYRHFEACRKPNPRYGHTPTMKPYTLKL